VPRAEELLDHAGVGGVAHLLRGPRVVEQGAQSAAKRREVTGVVEQQAVLAVGDLVLDAADATGDNGA
jgi:hypothetical protein